MAYQDEKSQVKATGTESNADQLRRRNVAPGQGQQNGKTIPKETEEKAKDAGNSFFQTLDEYEFLIAPLVFTALAFFTRMWKIGLSNIVTWDEAQ